MSTCSTKYVVFCERFDKSQDFLQTWDKSDEEIRALVLIAQFLQTLYNEGNSLKLWESGKDEFELELII